MRLKDKAFGAARGTFSVYKIKDNKRTKILTRSNTIRTEAAEILAQMMAGNTAAQVQSIRLYDTGFITHVATATPEAAVSIDGTEHTVTYQGNFLEDSFTGEVNAAFLGPIDMETYGAFAEAGPFSVTKGADEQLVIEWAIHFVETA